jgi:cell division protein FtsQ
MTTTTPTDPKAKRNPKPRPTPASAGAKPSSRIDPRMRARRVAVRRDEGRRRLRRLMTVAVVAAVACLVYLATRSPLFDVDHVQVSGVAHTSEDAVRAASAIEPGVPMTDVDLGRAESAIAALPWVDTVSVARDWPGTIEIRVSERAATATLLGSGGEWAIVDDTGRVLEVADGPAADRPTITLAAAPVAPGATQPGIAGAIEVIRRLTPDLAPWVQAVHPAEDGTVDLLLQQGIRVELGSQAHVADKLVDLATVLTRVDLTDLETIDVSVVHTPVTSRKAG